MVITADRSDLLFHIKSCTDGDSETHLSIRYSERSGSQPSCSFSSSAAMVCDNRKRRCINVLDPVDPTEMLCPWHHTFPNSTTASLPLTPPRCDSLTGVFGNRNFPDRLLSAEYRDMLCDEVFRPTPSECLCDRRVYCLLSPPRLKCWEALS